MFFITMGTAHPLRDAAGNLNTSDPEALSTFIHEYMHYLHNVSTMAGVSSFVLWQELIAEFSRTLDAKGRSRGATGMAELATKHVEQRLAFASFLDGDCELNGPHLAVTDFELLGASPTPGKLTLPNGTVEKTKLTLRFGIQTPAGKTDRDFHMGLIAIEEGIAYELDRIVASRSGPAPDNAPPFPYLVLRKLAEKAGPKRLHRIVLVACAVLALQTTDPPMTLLLELEDLARLEEERGALDSTPEGLAQAIDVLVQATKENRENSTAQALVDLAAVVTAHEGRGVAHEGAVSLTGLYASSLRLRLRDPFWELRPFVTNMLDLPALASLLGRALPCDVQQERVGSEDQPERDELLRFGDESEIADRAKDAIRVLQCELDFVYAHLDGDSFSPSNTAGGRCPFFTSCPLDLRKQAAATCKNKPWEILDLGRRDTCWYAAAVAALGGAEIASA